MNAPNLPPILLNIDDVVNVEANEHGLAAFTRHYGVRVKHDDHPAGTWRRSNGTWASPGASTATIWPNMTGEPTLHLGPGNVRACAFAAAAAEGMQREINRRTPANRRDYILHRSFAAMIVEPTRVRIVANSGVENPRRPLPVALQNADLAFEHVSNRHAELAGSGMFRIKEPVSLNPAYLTDIAARIGDELDLWLGGPYDPVGIRGPYGEAVLMPMKL